MGGFNSVTGLETIMFADNASFNGTERGGRLLTDGQLWIGRTTGTHVVRGVITSPDSSVLVGFSDPNITLSAGTAMGTLKTLTPDLDFDGSAATPISGTSGNINVLSYNPSFATVTDTLNSTGAATGNLTIEHRAWLTGLVVDPSSTLGTRGTFTTITAALAAAVSGQDIFIRPGEYIENITLKAGVNLVAFTADAYAGFATITGKCTASYSGSCTLSGINFRTNGDYSLSITGANPTSVTLVNCTINANDNASIEINSANSYLYCYYCQGLDTLATLPYFTMTTGNVYIYWCWFQDAIGASSTANTFAGGGNFYVEHTRFDKLITTSGTTFTKIRHSYFGYPLTINGTGIGEIDTSIISVAGASVLSVGAGADMYLVNSSLRSLIAATASGAGTIRYSNLSLDKVTITSTNQTPLVSIPGTIQVKTPGAYPYTTVPQDGLIKVDTSAAQTIIPRASPETGEQYIIKDTVGSAAANNITITPSGKNIDGAASYVINTNYGSVTICYNGSEWSIL